MSHSRADFGFRLATALAAAISGTLILAVVLLLLKETWPFVQAVSVRRLFTDPSWNPTEGQYSMAPMLAGGILVTVGAVLLAAPFGLCSAVFLVFYAPRWLSSMSRRLMEVAMGLPSVVYGLWGLTVVVPLIRRLKPPGASLLAAVLVLSMMIVPMLVSLQEVALRSLPVDYFRAARALGVSRLGTVWGLAVPAARPALISAIILASGRAVGETMAVLMVCGNVVQLPKTAFSPIRTVNTNIALEMPYALGVHRAALFAGGLLLVFSVLALAAANRFTGSRGDDGCGAVRCAP